MPAVPVVGNQGQVHPWTAQLYHQLTDHYRPSPSTPLAGPGNTSFPSSSLHQQLRWEKVENSQFTAQSIPHYLPIDATTWPGSDPGSLGYHIPLSMVARLLTVTECVPHWITTWLPLMLLSKATLVFLKRQQAYFLAFHRGPSFKSRCVDGT